MLKTKKSKLVLVAIVMFSMVAMYGYVPNVNAAISGAKDTISDSDISATGVTHTVTFTTDAGLATGDYIEIAFPLGAGGFSDIDVDNVDCPVGTTESVDVNDVICTVDNAATLATGAHTITVTGVTNGTAGSKLINISTNEGDDSVNEETEVRVYIIDDVTVTAYVPASLTFAIGTVGVGVTVNGKDTTVGTTATTIPFGNLEVGVPSIAAQELTVSTNADDGYSVTVQQSDELTNPGGSNINSFKNAIDGAGLTAPEVWSAPTNTFGQENTYGHMGLTTSDTQLTGPANPFGGSKFAGLDGTDPMEVMWHNGPADGNAAGIGKAQVAYEVEIAGLQEAGDYSTTLTYICTPQF